MVGDTFKLLRNSDEIVDGHTLEEDLPADRPSLRATPNNSNRFAGTSRAML